MAERSAGRSGLSLPGAIAWPLIGAGVLALLWGAYRLGPRVAGPEIQSSGPRIEEVRRLARLAVLRVQVANVIEGRTRGARAAVLVKGDCDIAVDLDQIEIAAKDPRQRTATLVLPDPRPERPRVDHDRTRLYEVRKTGLALLNPLADPRPALLADCMRAAQAEVERAVADPEFVAQAREHAELLLRSFYRELDWDVTVRWKEPAG